MGKGKEMGMGIGMGMGMGMGRVHHMVARERTQPTCSLDCPGAPHEGEAGKRHFDINPVSEQAWCSFLQRAEDAKFEWACLGDCTPHSWGFIKMSAAECVVREVGFAAKHTKHTKNKGMGNGNSNSNGNDLGSAAATMSAASEGTGTGSGTDKKNTGSVTSVVAGVLGTLLVVVIALYAHNRRKMLGIQKRYHAQTELNDISVGGGGGAMSGGLPPPGLMPNNNNNNDMDDVNLEAAARQEPIRGARGLAMKMGLKKKGGEHVPNPATSTQEDDDFV